MRYIPPINRKPHIFLSHSSEDKDFVRKLANDLLRCDVDVWLDEWEIEPGDSIVKQINSGIENSKFIALVFSKSFMISKWTTDEVESAIMKEKDSDGKVILPLLIELSDIPPQLKSKLYISFIDDYYLGLTSLAAIVHRISQKIISQALLEYNPKNINQVLETLRFCGVNPFAIIPFEVFEVVRDLESNQVKVVENQMWISNIDAVLEMNISNYAKKCLRDFFKNN